jgi:wyosine [tRNA(Phe)-imidazoG37] synthetase (radical SAM superfamily)
MAELDEYFRLHPQGADVLTFSSAGEPTLYEPLDELLRAIKRVYKSLPLVVLTNGSLLWDSRVRKGLLAADRVVPSLDTVIEETFHRLNRPHHTLLLPSIVEGIEAFRREYKGELHLEVLITSGFNDSPLELKSLSRVVNRINPDLVELNTVVRPPAYSNTCGLRVDEMEKAATFFSGQQTQIIGHFSSTPLKAEMTMLSDRLLDLVKRRPCTADEMAVSLAVPADEVLKTLRELEEKGRLKRFPFNEEEFFRIM